MAAGPRFLREQPADRKQGGSLTYLITVPDEPDCYLLVTAQVGSNCDDTAPAINLAQAKNPQAQLLTLTSIASVTGTPCTGNTHSELFELRAPPPGTYEITVAVAGVAPSLHSAALVFANVDPTTPTRTGATASGASAFSSVVVDSHVGDLIVNTTGHGAPLETAGPRQTEIFKRNVDTTTTLNNSSASFAAGTGAPIEMTWNAQAVDQWQTISTPLRSPGAP